MKRLTLACACLLGALISCANSPAPKGPKTPDVVESEETEPVAPKSTESPASTSEPAAAPTNTKVPCDSLQKTKCKVTQGCAWYEQGGKGKCQDE